MNMNKSKPNKTAARGQVAAAVSTLGRKIAANEFATGSTLPIEQELADSLSVGRNALREAVKVLSGKGLISTAPRAGTKIRPREDWNMLDPDVLEWHADPKIATPKFMLDIVEMRRIIEPKAAELAAVRASREDVADILAAYEQMETSEPSSAEQMAGDIAFHSAILKATHNVVLANFKHAISTYLKAHFDLVTGDPVIAAADLKRHRRIAWAIAGGKAETAYATTVEMLDENRKFIESKVETEKRQKKQG